MARNQSLNHRNSDFRPQTSDLIFALQLTVDSFQKAKQGLHLTFWRNGAVWYYRMIFLPASTQPR